MAGNYNYDPRWPNWYGENYRPPMPGVWDDDRLQGPDYRFVREEPGRIFYEGDQRRPPQYDGRYDGARYVPQHSGQQHYNGGVPLPMHEPGTPYWMQNNPPYDRNYDVHYRPRTITVELWMPLCCDKCERRVKQYFEGIQGAEMVTTDQVQRKVTVTGDVDPDYLLRCAQSHKADSTFWSTRG